MKDEEIIELFFRRNERAIRETNAKYGKYCHSIAFHILNNSADAEECVSDTLFRAWNSIPPTRPTVFQMYLGKIVRNIAFNKYEALRALKRGGGTVAEVLEELEECIPDGNDVEQTVIAKELEQIIRAFVNKLPKREAYVFASRYFYTESIDEIAKKYGMTKNNVNVMLSRMRKRLKDYLVKEEYIAS
ncbi:MAG: sigma-70 family RNA polymerase sigma factor [Lachnospiraceae bacterium]|nr:sigma-70 family RNA polymerase sigma factor [Lachnospiraceae bacterium]